MIKQRFLDLVLVQHIRILTKRNKLTMNKPYYLLFTILFLSLININPIISQEKKAPEKNMSNTNIGVINMQQILNESVAYQGLVEKFEDIRRQHRNKLTKQEDEIRDEENNLFKKKNINSKESYAVKVQELSKKINEIKQKKNLEVKKFEMAFEKSTNKIQRALVDVLSVIASKEKLGIVLAKSQVLLVGKEIDYTDQAIKELNKVLPKVKFEK